MTEGRTDGRTDWVIAYAALCMCVKGASCGKKAMKCILVFNIFIFYWSADRISVVSVMHRGGKTLNLATTANKANKTNETNVLRSSARYIATCTVTFTFYGRSM